MKKLGKSASIWLSQNWYWLVLILLISVPVLYSIHRHDNPVYWDGAIGNLLATLLGIIAGVPIALAIERERVKREGYERISESNNRAKQVSLLIKDELHYNLERLEERRKDKTSLPLQPFKVAIWKAMSDSTEIRWINHPHILSNIASAYYFINIVLEIEDKCYQKLRGINVQYSDGTNASQRLIEDARLFDNSLIQTIYVAIQSIDATFIIGLPLVSPDEYK